MPQIGRFLFRSDFDSGNLFRVTMVSGLLQPPTDSVVRRDEVHFDLEIATDAQGETHSCMGFRAGR